MTSLNYRVIRKEHESGEVLFQIHEVYYDEDGSIHSWTVDPVLPSGESHGELREDIRYFLSAFRKAVLEEAQENGKPDWNLRGPMANYPTDLRRHCVSVAN